MNYIGKKLSVEGEGIDIPTIALNTVTPSFSSLHDQGLMSPFRLPKGAHPLSHAMKKISSNAFSQEEAQNQRTLALSRDIFLFFLLVKWEFFKTS
jgi:hypothetical protein